MRDAGATPCSRPLLAKDAGLANLRFPASRYFVALAQFFFLLFTAAGRTCLRLSRGHFDVLIRRHFGCV